MKGYSLYEKSVGLESEMLLVLWVPMQGKQRTSERELVRARHEAFDHGGARWSGATRSPIVS